MDFKFIAISDTHLGEDCSLLSFPAGRQHLWHQLRNLFGGDNLEDDGKVKVEELILIGDIPDRTVSSTSQITTHTIAFMHTISNALDLRDSKVIYMPGNHDHTMWTHYLKKSRGGQKSGMTAPEGEVLYSSGGRQDTNNSAQNIFSTFFDMDHNGDPWVDKRRIGSFHIANPVYADAFKGRTYVFTHGTHFKPIVLKPPTWLKKLADSIGVDWLLGGIDIDPGKDPKKAHDLLQMEKYISPFVDSLWPSSKNEPTSRSDQSYYLYMTISGKLGNHRNVPAASTRFKWEELPGATVQGIFANLNIGELAEVLESFEKYFLSHLKNYLSGPKFKDTDMTLIFGDSHDGGWGRLTPDGGPEIRVYNTGGWVCHNKDDHPTCHIFAVDMAGQEYLADISFEGVQVEDQSLLELAATDAENKSKNVSKLLKLALDMFD